MHHRHTHTGHATALLTYSPHTFPRHTCAPFGIKIACSDPKLGRTRAEEADDSGLMLDYPGHQLMGIRVRHVFMAHTPTMMSANPQ